MELKLMCASTSMSQSYLYGIEIYAEAHPGRMTDGFNRTFMELK